ncbi:hypothetical protein AB0O20_36155 [Streptomyces kronopolitis]|uniref:hypothetical protein n=1 Tax=Streptomyces kronopolitis TaxID=1612435 RepID=UPI0034175012
MAAQQFLLVFRQIGTAFPALTPGCVAALEYRTDMHHRFTTWKEITDTAAIPTWPDRANHRPQPARHNIN